MLDCAQVVGEQAHHDMYGALIERANAGEQLVAVCVAAEHDLDEVVQVEGASVHGRELGAQLGEYVLVAGVHELLEHDLAHALHVLVVVGLHLHAPLELVVDVLEAAAAAAAAATAIITGRAAHHQTHQVAMVVSKVDLVGQRRGEHGAHAVLAQRQQRVQLRKVEAAEVGVADALVSAVVELLEFGQADEQTVAALLHDAHHVLGDQVEHDRARQLHKLHRVFDQQLH